MKKIVKLMSVVILGCLFFLTKSDETKLSANDKFQGNENAYLEKCARRLNQKEADECREFKKYYESLANNILSNSEKLKGEVEELKKDIDKLIVRSNELSAQIKTLQEQKAIIVRNINITEQNINEISKEIEDLKLKIEERKKEVKKRMLETQLQVNGNRNFIFLIESEDFGDLLRRSSILEQISKYDEERIILLLKDKETLFNEERELVRQKESLVSQKAGIEVKEKEIKVLNDTNQQLINTYLQNKVAIEEKIRQSEANYETIMKNASKVNTTASKEDIQSVVNVNKSNKGFIYPILGPWTKSAGTWYYPSAFGGGLHLGMDFAGHQGMGQPIVAPADAIVLMTNNDCGDYGGLGNYCGSPISGGGNWVVTMTEVDGTTYIMSFFHMKSGGITTKNKVSQGEVIGYMGTSGNSTGPHMHLEVISFGKVSLSEGYQKFVNSGYSPYAGIGFGIHTTCDNRGFPCRIRPETLF